MMRFDELLRNLDKSTMVGVEIGPFYSPVAPKAHGWKTTVIDFQDGEALRAAARNHKVEAIRKRADQIEDVDIVWSGEPLDTLALSRKPGGYDFFIATSLNTRPIWSASCNRYHAFCGQGALSLSPYLTCASASMS